MGITLETELSLFRGNLRKQGKPNETIEEYVAGIKRLLSSEDYDDSQALADTLAERANTVGKWSACSPYTQGKDVSIARQFLIYQAMSGKITSIPPINSVKFKKQPRPTISLYQLQTIVKKIPDTYVGKRDTVLFNLMAYAGLRTTEALSLTTDNLKYAGERFQITLQNESQKAPQTITLNKTTTKVLRDYLVERKKNLGEKESKQLFLSSRAESTNGITIRHPRRRFNRHAKAAGFPEIKLHHLRNFYIISLANAEKSNGEISKLARFSVQTKIL